MVRLLILCLVCSLAGCSGRDEPTDDDSRPNDMPSDGANLGTATGGAEASSDHDSGVDKPDCDTYCNLFNMCPCYGDFCVDSCYGDCESMVQTARERGCGEEHARFVACSNSVSDPCSSSGYSEQAFFEACPNESQAFVQCVGE